MSTTATGPTGTDQVWMADVEQHGPGAEATAHRTATRYRTGCGVSTRNGLTMPASQAAGTHRAVWCRLCWPAG